MGLYGGRGVHFSISPRSLGLCQAYCHPDNNKQQPTNDSLEAPPTRKEIKAALRKMKSEKSPGINGIPTEAFKQLTGRGLHTFENLIQFCWQDAEFKPPAWQKIKLSILPKKGDLSNSNNWRGIALGDIAAKCASSIIATRLLNKHLNSFGIDEQCGMKVAL
jgi:hypothetical protein